MNHLLSPRECIDNPGHSDCPHTTKQHDVTGRWFITMGHAGYNSPANNGDGYPTQKAALAAYRRYREAGRRRAGAV